MEENKESKNELEILGLQKQMLMERMARLQSEFELARRDMINVESELVKLKNEEGKKKALQLLKEKESKEVKDGESGNI